jgi:hypothetical protein
MPAKALWLLQIPEIVALLETFDVPVVDRAVIERLFGLRRRRAIELLHRFGGYQAGRTFFGRPAIADRASAAPDGWGRISAGKPAQRTSGPRRRSTPPASGGGAREDPRAVGRSDRQAVSVFEFFEAAPHLFPRDIPYDLE